MSGASDLFRDLADATLQFWNKNPTSSVIQHNALWRWMEKHGNIRDDIDGGLEIVEPVVLMENPTIQNFSGYQMLNTGAAEVTQLAKYPWCQKAMHVSASGLELNVNKGKSAMFKLVTTKIDAARDTAANRMAIEAYSDGTIADGLQGLEVFLQNDGLGTVGSIDSTLYSNWQNRVLTYATGSLPGTLPAMPVRGLFNKLYMACTIGDSQPDLIVCSNDIYEWVEETMQIQMRYPYPYAENKEANFGFTAIPYKKAALMHDANVNFAETAQRAYFLKTDDFYFYEHPDAKWDKEEPRTPVNQNSTVIPFYWMGGFAVKARRNSGKLIAV